MSTDATVTPNADEQRFEVHTSAGELAGFTQYADRDGVRDFRHTEIDDAYEGQGLGGALVRGALDHSRVEGFTVTATCPFVRKWIDEHPDYQDLLA